MRFVKTYVLLLLLGLATPSCINEDRDNCPAQQDYSVVVRFTYGPEQEPVYNGAEEASDLGLYVFDDQGYLVDYINATDPVLDAAYRIPLGLTAGTYDLISWINILDVFDIDDYRPGELHIDQMELHMKTDSIGVMEDLFNDVFFGQQRSVTVTGTQDHEFFINMRNNSYSITVRTEGMIPTWQEHELRVNDHHGGVKVDNSILDVSRVHYRTVMDTDELGQISGTVRVNRLSEEYLESVVNISNTENGDILLNEQLVPLLMSLGEYGLTVDFDTVFDYEIVLYFDGSTIYSIAINGWKVWEDGWDIS